jgi:LysR family glycine cleavage system transcriptional activator
MAKGRLVVPFDIPLPADAGFYFVTPQDRATAPKLNALRDWRKAAVKH